MADLTEFDGMNAVYTKYVGAPPPARATVQVARLPRDVKIEIDAIAVIA
jgi:2-iminobutanoate/2-iminopropanoate deaminase